MTGSSLPSATLAESSKARARPVQAPDRKPADRRSWTTSHDWFTELFGFREKSYAETQNRFQVTEFPTGEVILKGESGESYRAGRFQTPKLSELENQVSALGGMERLPGRLRVCNIVGDVADILAKEDNRLATFQVASQFNCLEFPGPSVIPEDGVTGYVYDKTQGPACSIACGPATAYRNYLAEVNGQRGQTSSRQIDNLRDVVAGLGGPNRFFKIKGGYTLAEDSGLKKLNNYLQQLDAGSYEALRRALRVGVHETAQVTSRSWGRVQVRDKDQLVTQVFGSACSVSYSGNGKRLWEPFARLVLSASYEATLWAALAGALRHKGAEASRRVFLTCLGGGVFGNDMEWIADAMREALTKFKDVDLTVYIVTYSDPVDPELIQLAKHFAA